MLRVLAVLFLYIAIFFLPLSASAQIAQKDVLYNASYQLKTAYTIKYDNPAKLVKINAIKIEFFNAEKIGEVTINHPIDQHILSHDLDEPITGFNAVKVSVLSLHTGQLEDLNSSDLMSILALSEDDELPDDLPPNTRNIDLEIAAGENLSFDLSPYSSDDQGDLRFEVVANKPARIIENLQQKGVISLTAPDITGHYSLSYRVIDRADQTSLGHISLNVSMPDNMLEDLRSRAGDLSSLNTEIDRLSEDNNHVTDNFLDEIEILLAKNNELLATRNNWPDEAQQLSDNLQNIVSRVSEQEDEIAHLKQALAEKSALLSELDTRFDMVGNSRKAVSEEIDLIKEALDTISAAISGMDFVTIEPADLENWTNLHNNFAHIDDGKTNSLMIVLLSLIAIICLGIIYGLRGHMQRSSSAPAPPKPPKGGVIFPKSPMLAGAVAPGATALVPSGQMIPSGLQSLTGSYAALKPAYLATGRIGGPQEGIPTHDDVAFGTGFLITPTHVMTNQHVYEFYKHYLTGADCGGIEFIAESGCDDSDYVAFDGSDPIILPELDIAIFRLQRPVTHRTPIARVATPTHTLDEREVVVISYPCPFDVDDFILSVVEENPIFAVKRISQGRIFRHSTDIDDPYGVDVSVEKSISPREKIDSICHNASTLGGLSLIHI